MQISVILASSNAPKYKYKYLCRDAFRLEHLTCTKICSGRAKAHMGAGWRTANGFASVLQRRGWGDVLSN